MIFIQHQLTWHLFNVRIIYNLLQFRHIFFTINPPHPIGRATAKGLVGNAKQRRAGDPSGPERDPTLLLQFLKKHLWLIPTAVSILFLTTPASAAKKNVLILDTYHQNSEMTESIMQDMMDVFNNSGMDLDIHVEYLDTTRHPPSESYYDLLEDFYSKKYIRYHFDAIIVSDVPALEFILSRRERIFPGVPVVFCRINDFQDARIKGQSGITGINEGIDVKANIELALKIDPGIKKFLIINDRSAPGLITRAKYERVIAGFRAGGPAFELFDEYTPETLKARLAALPKDAAVLILRFPFGQVGQLEWPVDYLKIVVENCKAPVFTVWEGDIGKGVLGGVVIDTESEGKLAAQYALRILHGEPVSSLPILMESPTAVEIDYRQLKRFGIPEEVIPKSARILFKPESVFDEYRHEIVGAILFVSLLVVIILTLFANIAVRKRTEKALLKSEEKLSSALEMARLGHWELDVTKRIFKFTDQFYAIFRTTAKAMGGYTMTWDEYVRRFVYPEDMPAVDDEIRKAIESPDTLHSRRIEHRIRFADGAIGHMAVRAFSEKDAQGRTVRAYGVNQDITELRQAEENLIRSEERWRMILQTAMDGFSLADTEGRFIEVNDAYCRMLGYSREELLKKYIGDIGASKNPEEFQRHIQEIIRKGQDRFETKLRRKDGSVIDVEISVQYRRSPEGDLHTSFLRDVTERKQIESRLQQSQKMEAIGTLAGGIAHDFNNILQPMLGFCEFLKADLPPGCSQQDFVDGILKAGLRAKELVDQILSFSRQEDEGTRPIKLQPVIQEAMKLLRSSIPKTIDIEQDISPDCGVVFADPTQIYQIVMNLCTNAYHAMETKGGTLKIALKPVHLEAHNPAFPGMTSGAYALLTVSDTGPGIPRTIIDKIFDPYFTTKEKTKGTGLGLSIVQGTVKRYNGDIRIYSEFGKGTEVLVYLPIMAHGEADNGGSESSPIQSGTGRILLVDDEKPVVEIIHRMLERLGYRVSPQIESLEALRALQSSPDDFDLVITDLIMPHMTGLQLAGEIMRIRGDLPIILCTGFSEQVTSDQLKKAGIRARISKPVVMKDLAEAIRKTMAEAKSGQ